MMISERTFHPFSLEGGSLLADLHNDAFPATFSCWNAESVVLATDATHFGYVASGTLSIENDAGSFVLNPGMYFSIPGTASLKGSGAGIFVSQHQFNGHFHVGGPVEEKGRLRYIDGCTDSLLIPPIVMGDPCLNLLHIPPGTAQTQHTHPSFRAGLILSGHGHCITPDGRHELTPGLPFLIPKDAMHSFHTHDAALRVIAYHPDSDYGPTHEVHPMVNRTIIEESHP